MQVFDGHRFSFSWAAWGGMKHPVRAENSSSKVVTKREAAKYARRALIESLGAKPPVSKAATALSGDCPRKARLEARGAEGYAKTNATDNGRGLRETVP
jgi:hypothetical protein